MSLHLHLTSLGILNLSQVKYVTHASIDEHLNVHSNSEEEKMIVS